MALASVKSILASFHSGEAPSTAFTAKSSFVHVVPSPETSSTMAPVS